MNQDLDGDGRFFLAAKPAWTDFGRAKYLKKLIVAAEARLDILRRAPRINEEAILNEESIMSSARDELIGIKRRTFFA